jgi:D-alanine-D-alanine ligase
MTSNDSGQSKIRVAVLFGGQSAEHDVSLRSAQTIIGALDPERFEVVPVGITRQGQWLTGGDPMQALTSASPMFHLGEGEQSSSESVDEETFAQLVVQAGVETSSLAPSSALQDVTVVIPALHGPMGEDGTVQGMLELTGMPYVGSGVLGSSVAMDKAIAKTILEQAGMPQVPWQLVNRRDWQRDPAEVQRNLEDTLGYPMFVKPSNMGSSVGVSKVSSPSEFDAAMREAGHFDRRIVVEKGISAREVELAVLGNDDPIASVAGEVIPAGEFYDYNAKYVDDDAQLLIPADIPPDTLARLQEYAVKAFLALDLAGLARADFFIEKQTGQIYINEVNTLPGFTSISMYPMLWAASGVPLSDLVERLVQLAIERHGDR